MGCWNLEKGEDAKTKISKLLWRSFNWICLIFRAYNHSQIPTETRPTVYHSHEHLVGLFFNVQYVLCL